MNFFSSIFGAAAPSITAKDVDQKLTSQESVLVLDAREREEYRSGHIDGAILIPLGELSRRTNELPKDRLIICVCHSGSRSLRAARFLRSAGFNPINMNRGMMAWQGAGFPVITGAAQ